jgi:ABC-type multidrug transport system ATPase subunit
MIITAHLMIEADTLCNRIAIVAHGKLKVVGTQQAFKYKFGSGYLLELNLVKSTQENQEAATAFFSQVLAS